MKGVIGCLFVFVMMISFAVAASSSSTRTDFYVDEDVIVSGDDGEVKGVIESSEQTEWLRKFIYWSLIVIAVGVFIKFLLRVVGGSSRLIPLKKRTRKVKKSKSGKKKRRKK